jgi:hypothetical protein
MSPTKNDSTTRREFIKGATIISTGLVVANPLGVRAAPSATTPQGNKKAIYDRYIEAAADLRHSLAAILKPENIIDDPAVLEGYSKDYSFAPRSSPILVAYPENREEVQGIARLANQSRIPLVPVSSGPPRFRGDTVPSQGGIITDFSRMKRIMKIDPVNRCAMVEPGVTYGQLIAELKKEGLKLNIPLLPRAGKSVVTSRLEREPNLIPKYQFDYTDPLLTIEAIYGTGDDFRTGSASGPGILEKIKADKVNPWGPGSIDYFKFLSGAQGTMGLVTWATTKVEVLPSRQKLYFIPIEDISKLTVPMIRLIRRRVVDECLALNAVNLATMLAETWPEDFEELRMRLPSWTILACLSGYQRRPEERINIQEKYLRDICADLQLRPLTNLPGAEGKEGSILKLLSNSWEREPYWKLRYKGACHDIFFLTILSKAPQFIELMKSIVARYRYSSDDIGCYIQPMVQGRGCHCEFSLPCNKSNSTEVAEVKELFMNASESLKKNGAFFSRPYGSWADMVYDEYTEGVKVLRKLKGVFDPNNILNPGKLCY